MDWVKEIAIAVLVKRKVADADVEHVWDHAFPGVAATEQEIGDIEARLGFSLDAEHRAFLLHANGWDWFFQSVDVFGTSDLLEGSRCQRAEELLKSLESLSDLCGFSRDELLPIAVSRFNTDVFAISTSRSQSPGTVLWFAGQVIDTFPSFSEWFLSLVDYNRSEYQALIEGK